MCCKGFDLKGLKMILANLFGRFMFQERRKNRPLDIQPVTRSNVYMMAALAKIANMTVKEMPDCEQFRMWAQKIAHEAIAKK